MQSDHGVMIMTRIPTARIAVIGAGPKAAALAAKAKVISALGLAKITIEIFEPNRIGANWYGDHGYTDGKQELCTPAERDLGFPYASTLQAKRIPRERQSASIADLMSPQNQPIKKATSLHRKLDEKLYSQYSWASHLLAIRGRYGSWIDAGRHAPTHREFAEYLQWAIKKTRTKIHNLSVTGLLPQKKKWTVLASGKDKKIEKHRDFNGVVVTGPGNSRVVSHHSDAAGRVFNGQNLWKNSTTIKRLLTPEDSSVIIIGGGGTGAAVIAWLVRAGFASRTIHLIAQQATLYMRADNVFDNRLFSDDGLWNTLTPETQDIFFNRLNRGVVWAKSLREIEQASALRIRDGKAKSIRVSGVDELEVKVSNSVSSETVKGTLVIDASGFDNWWFTKLLPETINTQSWTKKDRASLQAYLTDSLSLEHPLLWKDMPNLHVPNISERRGPGLGSLMALGTMSDRILSAYIPQA